MTQSAHTTESDLRELRVLEQIERNPRVSQRQLARELGVALGVANACVNTLVRKGLVKIRGESNRSLTYHLTKQGVLRKAALALEWTNNTITDYITARATVRSQLDALAERGYRRVAIIGADEAAELIALIAPEAGIEVVAAVDVDGRRIADALAGVPVKSQEAVDASSVDAAIVSSSRVGFRRLDSSWSHVPLLALSGQAMERSAV